MRFRILFLILLLVSSVSTAAAQVEDPIMVDSSLVRLNVGVVVFDRNGYIYHGCVKAFADAAREAGLQF